MKKMILALCLAGCLVGCKSKKEAKKKSEIKTSPTIVKTSFKYDGKGYLKESILYAAGKDGLLTESSNSYEVSNDSGKKYMMLTFLTKMVLKVQKKQTLIHMMKTVI